MRKFTKEEYLEWLELDTNPDDRDQNRLIELTHKMCDVFPFLIVKNRFNGLVDPDYDYTYNEWSFIPYGWSKAFGYDLLIEIYKKLKFHRHLKYFRIDEIKEKWGHLDINCTYYKYIEKILDKYWRESINYCIVCGNHIQFADRYYPYLCQECVKERKRAYEKAKTKSNDN